MHSASSNIYGSQDHYTSTIHATDTKSILKMRTYITQTSHRKCIVFRIVLVVNNMFEICLYGLNKC